MSWPGWGRRRHKYNARPTWVDGHRFPSAREADRYKELKFLSAAGKIRSLVLQVPYRLEVNGVLIATYRADFVYVQDGDRVIEDCKGVRTPEYKLKKKLFEAIYGTRILET